MWLTSSVVLTATNTHEPLAWRYLISAVINLPVCYGLSLAFGLHGAAISAMLVDLALIPFVLRASLRMTRDNFRGFVMESIQTIREVSILIKVLLVPTAQRAA